MKIFFFGGTFDPPHKGHFDIVKYLFPLCDKFIVIPAAKSPDKVNYPIADTSHRINMLKLLFNKYNIEIDDYEIKKNNKNYSFETIKYLKKKYQRDKLYMIIGKDQLLNFGNWKEYKFIIENVNIICINRHLENKDEHLSLIDYGNIKFIDNFSVNVSSTEIRNNIKSKSSFVLDNMDSRVIEYIKENKLYV
tara:strand:+ start:121 stop:696 length:576 start_codon:yes stop_codon:yes gene_type:complete